MSYAATKLVSGQLIVNQTYSVSVKFSIALYSDEKVIAKLSVTLIEKIQTLINDMGILVQLYADIFLETKIFNSKSYLGTTGITADMSIVFKQGGFCVLRVHILSAEKSQLLRASKGEAFANKFQELLVCLEFLGMEEALGKIDNTILTKVPMKWSFCEFCDTNISLGLSLPIRSRRT